MKKITLSLMSMFLVTSMASAFNLQYGDLTIDGLADYLGERLDLPGLDSAGSGCSIEDIEKHEDGTLTFTLIDLNRVMSTILKTDARTVEGEYNGTPATYVRYEYVFDRVDLVLNSQGELRHISMEKIFTEEDENGNEVTTVLDRVQCSEFMSNP